MKRNKLRKLLALGLSAALALTVLAGCSTTTGGDSSSAATGSADTGEGTELAAEQTFTFVSANDLMTLDVAQAQDEMSAIVLYATSEGLLRYYNGEVIPGIAETYDISEDGTVYTFHLRDALWSDGEPVTAGDFEYAFLRMLDPNTGSPQVEYLSPVVGAEDYYSGVTTDPSTVGIVAQDDKTLVITLEAADPFFLEQLAQGINFYPVRQDYVEQYGASYGSSPETYIGCGPFVLTEWVQSASITMERNENYWNKDAVTLTQVTELIVGDENTRVGMYNLGEVDAIYSISATQTVSFPDYGSKSGGTVQHLVFQCSDGSVMSNKNLRLALSWAIDRQSIVTAVASPGTEVIDSLLDPSITLDGESVAANYPASTGIPDSGDLDKAKEYLQAALDEMGLSSASELPEIRYVCLDSTAHKAYAEALQAQWKQNLGVNVTIDTRPVAQAIGALLEGDFDIFLNSMSSGVQPNEIIRGYTIGNANNYAKWDDETFTDLMTRSMASTDVDEMLTLFQQAHQYILDECVMAPLWVPGTAYLCQDYVQDLYYGRETGSIEFIYASILAH